MAVRTTAIAVKQIISTSLDDTIVDAYITGASSLVDEVLGTNSGLSSTLLTEIEKWLAAHMIASTRERQSLKEEAGTAKITYTGQYTQGLRSTSYGQMVISLDPTGAFAATEGKSARIVAIQSFDS